MKDFGTFDTLTDEEDTLYNRLAAIRRELERLEFEQNEARQDIKMWRIKIADDKFKVKFWLAAALIVGIGVLPWYQIVLLAIPSGIGFHVAFIFNWIATFLAMMQRFVFLPLFLVLMTIFLVRLVLHILRSSKTDKIKKLAENMGVQNRQVLIEEQRGVVVSTAGKIEQIREEEEKLKARLQGIQKAKEA